MLKMNPVKFNANTGDPFLIFTENNEDTNYANLLKQTK